MSSTRITPDILSHTQIFAVPTGTFIKYQTKKALPYWIKRYVLFKKTATLEPLYQMDQDLDGSENAQFRRQRTRDVRDVEAKV